VVAGAAVGDRAPEDAPKPATMLEVHLPGGVRLLVATSHQATPAAHLIEALQRSC
jgi:hypothetical protein